MVGRSILMQVAIVLDNNGDLLFFRDVEQAETYVEPIDVRNGEYTGFDAEGRTLSLSVESRQEGGVLGRLGGRSERVAIASDVTTAKHRDQLERDVRDFLRRAGVEQQWLDTAPLEALIGKGLELQGR
jgi:hypothetical protein